MSDHYEIIDAFADGERVAADALAKALESEAGRRYLIDIIALREIAGEELPAAAARAVTDRRPLRWLAVAAALALAVVGGYQAGIARGGAAVVQPTPGSVAAESAPPAPTVVIKLDPGTTWEEPAKGGRP
jgi:hypothetical protein